MSSFVSQSESNMFNRFGNSVAGQLQASPSVNTDENPAQLRKAINELVASFALTNKMLAATYGAGIPDRRSGQTYYIDIGLSLPNLVGAGTDALDASVFVNTSRISELVSPSLGTSDLKFSIGVDAFSIHRYAGAPTTNVFPITIACDKLQAASGARYLTVLAGETGSALSGTAQSIFYGELPSSLEFRIGFMSPVPVDSNGVLSQTVFPISFKDDWKNTAAGLLAPRIFGTNDLMWSSSGIYAMSVRLYVIPMITPRPRLMDQ